MKHVLKLKTKKKARFNWTLDENKYLDVEDVQKIRKYCLKQRKRALLGRHARAVRDWFMVELGLNAGLRVKEMANLKSRDILIDNEQSSIIATGKRGKRRSIWISSDFKDKFKWFMKWKKENGQETEPESYVLTSNKSKKLTTRTLQKDFKKCVENAGLSRHYSIHCLRHTYGSHLYLASGHNLRLVQEQLGHSSVRVTEVYASLMNKDAKGAVERLYK